MKKIVMTLAVALLICAVGRGVYAEDIRDMSRSHFAYNDVQYLLDNGYLTLYDDGTFRGDLPISREVFATAIKKLIDQIESGEVGVGGTDVGEIKKISDAFKNEIADYQSRMKAMESKMGDVISEGVVSKNDLSKAVMEYREGFDDEAAANEKIKRDMAIMADDIKALNASVQQERKDRKSAQMMMWVGIVAAIAVGAGS